MTAWRWFNKIQYNLIEVVSQCPKRAISLYFCHDLSNTHYQLEKSQTQLGSCRGEEKQDNRNHPLSQKCARRRTKKVKYERPYSTAHGWQCFRARDVYRRGNCAALFARMCLQAQRCIYKWKIEYKITESQQPMELGYYERLCFILSVCWLYFQQND